LDGMKHSCNTLDTQRSACADESPNRCDWNRYRFFSGSDENWSLFSLEYKMLDANHFPFFR
jgi:hypothetical protein